MSDFNEYRRILERTRELARVQIDPREARDAVSVVRHQLGLKSARASNTSRRNRLLLMSGSIAATIGVIVVLCGVLVMPPRKVDAAEELQAAASATHGFKGWVHITLVDRSFFAAIKPVVILGIHVNTENDSIAVAFRFLGMNCVEMTAPAKHERLQYTGGSGEIRVLPIDNESAASLTNRNGRLPLNLSEFLSQLKRWGLRAPAIAESMEEGLKRFDLTPLDDPRKVPEDYREMMSDKIVIWVDPRTDLIRRVQQRAEGKPLIMEYAYGPPDIRDIYDLNVPHSATILDERPTAYHQSAPVLRLPTTQQLVKDDSVDVKSLRDRLDKRINSDFGDYCLVECEARTASHEERKITLQAVQGNQWMEVGYESGTAWAYFDLTELLPADFQHLKLADVLSKLKSAFPRSGGGFDGKNYWSTGMHQYQSFPTQPTTGKIEPIVQTVSTYLMNSPGARFWRTSDSIGSVFITKVENQSNPNGAKYVSTTAKYVSTTTLRRNLSDVKAEILRDPSRPKLIVLHEEETANLYPVFGHRADTFCWIDPARDDLPVEIITRTVQTVPRNQGAAGSEDETLMHTVNLDFAQLSDGRWYPTHWQERSFQPSTTQPTRDLSYTDNWRQLTLGAKLDADWFGDPFQRWKDASMHTPATAPVR